MYIYIYIERERERETYIHINYILGDVDPQGRRPHLPAGGGRADDALCRQAARQQAGPCGVGCVGQG